MHAVTSTIGGQLNLSYQWEAAIAPAARPNMLWRDQGNQNGTFVFDTDQPFNANDYATWPERLPSGSAAG